MINRMGDRKKRMTMTRALLLALGVIALGPALAACAEEPREGARESASERAVEKEEGPSARLTTAEFSVEGMTCGGCALATEMAVRKLEGVESVDAEYDDSTGEGRCSVEYDPAVVGTDEIAEAIRGAGFTPSLSSGPSSP